MLVEPTHSYSAERTPTSGGFRAAAEFRGPPVASLGPCGRPSQRRCGGGARGKGPFQVLKHCVIGAKLRRDPRLTSFHFLVEVKTRPQDAETLSRVPSYLKLAPSSKSRPIAIERPSGRRRADSIPAPEPIPLEPPLSARGDIAGYATPSALFSRSSIADFPEYSGYFPLHEDPDARLHIPHPFHADTNMARRASHARAAESSRVTASTTSPAPDTPLSSYLPSGHHHDVVVPLGKYYPSNWEKRHGKAPLPHPVHSSTPPHPAATTTTSPSSSHHHHHHRPHHHHHHTDQPRPASDAKRRLQQYQRDMVAQAAMAGNAVLANSPFTATAPSSLGGGGGGSLPLAKAQRAVDLLQAYRPVSPVLRPVGSPGPVTPMSLEQDGDCYLSYHGLPSAGAGAAKI